MWLVSVCLLLGLLFVEFAHSKVTPNAILQIANKYLALRFNTGLRTDNDNLLIECEAHYVRNGKKKK